MHDTGFANDARRVEDARFLTGAGCYSDDVAADGAAHAMLVRSPHAHADIVAIDTSDAEAMPGVLGVYTSAELTADGLGGIPCLYPVEGKGGAPTTCRRSTSPWSSRRPARQMPSASRAPANRAPSARRRR